MLYFLIFLSFNDWAICSPATRPKLEPTDRANAFLPSCPAIISPTAEPIVADTMGNEAIKIGKMTQTTKITQLKND